MLRHLMKVSFEKMSELPQYVDMLGSCVTDEMIVPNSKDIKIIIHTPKSLLQTKVGSY